MPKKPRVPNACMRTLVVGDRAATAIRFAEERTGQSYAQSFRAQRTAAADDSTRALYAALLVAMRNSVFSTSEF